MSQSEPSFTEAEERYLIAEIIKQSNISPMMLLTVLRDAQTEVPWAELALPYGAYTAMNYKAGSYVPDHVPGIAIFLGRLGTLTINHGRSLSACQRAYASMQARMMAADPQHSFYRRFSLGSADLDRANAQGRELMPRPPSFLGMPGGSQLGLASSKQELPPRKKRGRPNKEEFERRRAEAMSRGEEYPKRRPKSAKKSATTVTSPQAQITSPQQATRPPTSLSGSQADFGFSPTGTSSGPVGGISMESLLLPSSPIMPLPPGEASPSISSGRQSRAGFSVGISSPEAPSRPPPGASSGSQGQVDPSTGVPGSWGPATTDAAQQGSRQRPTVSSGPSVPCSQASLFLPAENPYGV